MTSITIALIGWLLVSLPLGFILVKTIRFRLRD